MFKKHTILLVLLILTLVISIGYLYSQNQNAKQGIYNEYIMAQQGIRTLLQKGIEQFENGKPDDLTRNLGLINLHYAGIHKITGGSIGEFIKFPRVISYFDTQARDLILGKYSIAVSAELELQDIDELKELNATLNDYTEYLTYEKVIKSKSPSQIRREMIEIAEQLEFEKQLRF